MTAVKKRMGNPSQILELDSFMFSKLNWGSIADWMTFALVAGALCISYYEFEGSKKHEKIVNSMNFVGQYRDSEFVTSMSILHDVAIDIKRDLNRILSAPKLDKDKAIRAYVTHAVVYRNIHKDFLRVFNFYENFAVCMANDICDCESGTEYVGTGIRSLWGTYAPYIYEIREKTGDINYASATERYYRSVIRNNLQCE